MERKNIYIDVSHSNYWWGVYSLEKLTDWEDVIIYEKRGRGFKKLAWTCVCSKTYLISGLNELRQDPEEAGFVSKVDKFLENNKIFYNCYYDKREFENFYEVPFEAEKNELGIKPRSIETWYPSEGIDKDVLDNVVRDFCKEFLNIEVDSVFYKDEVSMEEARETYLEEMITLQMCKGIKFSESLIEQIENELKIPKETVIKLINRSVKG